jgi:hypothetical protein
MLLIEDRERLTEIYDRLLQLYVLRRDATDDGDLHRLQAVNKEIAPLEAERQSIRRWDTVGAA